MRSRLRGRALPWGVSIVWTALALAQVVRLRGWTVDDFYITYRYARNLAQGHGFVFNLGERVFGSSDPGLGLLLALLHGLSGAPIDGLASLLFAGALVGVAILLAREGGWSVETLLGGTLVLLAPFVWSVPGAAAPLSLLLLLLGCLWVEERPLLAGTLAGLAAWVRPDALLGVLLLALLAWRERRRLPWRFACAAGLTVALGLLWAWSYYGSPLPGTLSAKITMTHTDAASPAGWRFWQGALRPFERLVGPSWPWVLGLGAVGSWLWFRRAGRAGKLFVLLAWGLALAYPLLGTPFFSWYALLPVMAACYGVAFFAGELVRWVVARPTVLKWYPGGVKPVWVGLATLALAGLIAAGPLRRMALLTPHSPTLRHQRYVEAARWICAHSSPEATVAHTEIGALGYYCHRQLEDLMGLVTPRVLPFVARYDTEGAFLSKPTDFLLHLPGNRLEAVVRAPWFPERYEAVARFPEDGPAAQQVTLYRRREEGSR